MVKSEKIYTLQSYLKAITGKAFIVDGDNDIEFIESVLAHEGFELWNYPMSEIDHIVENNLDVVLVNCMVVNEETNQFEHIYRWFEVPEGF